MATIAPSILSADFANLQREMDTIKSAQARWVHVDVMDGHFVPNITIGAPVVTALRRVTDLTMDVHLMIDDPLRYVEDFCAAGADYLTVHLEADTSDNIRNALRMIRAKGVKAGLSVKPGTPGRAVERYLTECDLILVMTVEPGFGGQSFMTEMLDKLRYLRRCRDQVNPGCLLEVDGGVNPQTAVLCREAGADVLVSGSGFFKAQDKEAFARSIEGK